MLLLGDYRQDGGYEVVALNGDMNRQSITSIKGNIHTLKADSGNAYILAGSQYYQIDLLTGEHLVEEPSEYLYDLEPIGKGVFAITNEEIVRMEQVKAEKRQTEGSIVPEQSSSADDELEDWELPDESESIEEVPEETPEETPSTEGETAEDVTEELPEENTEEVTPSTGTKPEEPGL